MALDRLFLVKHQQTFGLEPILNLYTYEADTGMTAVDVLNAFTADMLPAIRGMQASQIVTRGIVAYSLGNLSDYAESSLSLAGLLTGETILPVFNAINFTLRPVSRAVRPGSKRIAGISEAAQADGVVTDSAWLAAIEAARLAMADPISDDDTSFAYPVIVKRVKYLPEGNVAPDYAYRYPEIGETPVYARLGGVKTTPKISHQTSRGNGK